MLDCLTTEKLTTIRPDEVHIHLLQIGEEPAFKPDDTLITLLPSDERLRFSRIESEAGRREYLWSRLLLRRLLYLYLDSDMENLRFSFGDKGKPFIEDSRLKFNLSHTDGLIACSFGWNEVGVDVEKVDVQERPHWKSLAKRYFSPAEYKYLSYRSYETQAFNFFRIFTMKEAYVKAAGCGLSFPLNAFSVPLPPAERSRSGSREFFSKAVDSGHYCLGHVLDNPAGIEFKYHIHNWSEESIAPVFMNDGLIHQRDVA